MLGRGGRGDALRKVASGKFLARERSERQAGERLVRGLAPTGANPWVRLLPPKRKKVQKDFCLAGVEGIEPSSGVLETLILPMNYTPKCFFIVQ